MPTPTQIQVDDDRSVTLVRSFNAPRPVIWQAFTQTAILARWLLGPPGWTMDLCENLLEPGGGYRWRWRCPDTGQTFGFKGTYGAVEPGQRLIDKQVFDLGDTVLRAGGGAVNAATKNTVLFHDDGPGCRVVTTIRYPAAALRDAVVTQGLGDGMEASYQRLDRLLLRAAA